MPTFRPLYITVLTLLLPTAAWAQDGGPASPAQPMGAPGDGLPPTALSASAQACLAAIQARASADPNTWSVPEVGNQDQSCRALANTIEVVSADTLDVDSATHLAVQTAASGDAGELTRAAASTPGASGTAAQVGAAPTVETVPTAGGDLALSGTDEGTRILTTISLNPLGLLNADDAQAYAKSSRIFDLSVSLPIDPAAESMAVNDIDFVGVRARLNLVGSTQGEKVYEKRLELVRTTLRTALLRTGTVQAAIEAVIERAVADQRELGACVDALLAAGTRPENVETACGAPLVDLANYQEALAANAETTRTMLDESDLYYVGLDIRGDFGNADYMDTLGAKGTSISARLAVGGHDTSHVRSGLRGSVGASYMSLWEEPEVTAFGVEGALALETSVTQGEQVVALSAGLEGCYSSSDERLSTSIATLGEQTTYLEAMFGLSVPASDKSNIDLGLSLPLYGGSAPILTLSADWLALVPD